MKKSSRIMIGLVLAAVFAVPAGGCSKRAPDDENTLEIELYKAGYGETFLHALAEEYEKNHEGVKIYINASSEESLIRTHLPSGPSNNTVDLYLQGDSYFDLMGETGGVDFLGVHYENKLADLTDVYNAVIPGENVTVKQKMFDDYEAYHNVGDGERGKYYQFPWAAGIGGIIIIIFFRQTAGKYPTRPTNCLPCANGFPPQSLPMRRKNFIPLSLRWRIRIGIWRISPGGHSTTG